MNNKDSTERCGEAQKKVKTLNLSHQDTKVSKTTKVKIVSMVLNSNFFVSSPIFSAPLRLSVKVYASGFLGVLGVLVAKFGSNKKSPTVASRAEWII